MKLLGKQLKERVQRAPGAAARLLGLQSSKRQNRKL
jgi:hypothetical protein